MIKMVKLPGEQHEMYKHKLERMLLVAGSIFPRYFLALPSHFRFEISSVAFAMTENALFNVAGTQLLLPQNNSTQEP